MRREQAVTGGMGLYSFLEILNEQLKGSDQEKADDLIERIKIRDRYSILANMGPYESKDNAKTQEDL